MQGPSVARKIARRARRGQPAGDCNGADAAGGVGHDRGHPDRPVVHLSLGNPHSVVGVDEVGVVDLALLGQCRDQRRVRVLVAVLLQHLPRLAVIRFTVKREPEIIDEIVMTWVEQGVLAEPFELPAEGLVELLGMTAVGAVTSPGVEQRIAAEQRRLIRVR